MKKYYPEILVFLQLSFIALLLVSGPIFNHFNFWLVIEILGIVLVFWAFYKIKWNNINIRPIVKPDGILITSGPYQIIRHPMYSATLLVMIALVGEYFSIVRLGYLLTLLIVYVLKIEYEEKALKAHFSTYRDYIKKTNRLIPFIY